MILDRVVEIAGAREFVVHPVEPAAIAQQNLPDFVPVDQFAQFRVHAAVPPHSVI
jgi:hypothetical protein